MGISYFDLHCDTLGVAFNTKQHLYKNRLCVDFERMRRFSSAGAFFAIWAVKEEYPSPFEYVRKCVNYFKGQIAENGEKVMLVSPKDYFKLKASGKALICLSVEGGDALESDLDNIYKLKNMGIGLLTLVWNNKNELGCGTFFGCGDGLTGFGKSALSELEKTETIVDVSHLNERGFADVCCLATKPFLATHSNCFKICSHERNLKDWQIKEIARFGGVIGLNLYSLFLNGRTSSSVLDVLKHADHITKIAKTTDCIAIGTDFDGMPYPVKEMNGISGMSILKNVLTKAFGSDSTEKILWKNAANFFERFYSGNED